jgi:peptide/nickel transport system permease protein
LLSGTIFTERIFGIDGVGNWSLNALQTPMDLQVIEAAALLLAVSVVLSNLIVDILYSFLDPRVSIA